MKGDEEVPDDLAQGADRRDLDDPEVELRRDDRIPARPARRKADQLEVVRGQGDLVPQFQEMNGRAPGYARVVVADGHDLHRMAITRRARG
jgi:hypothetical protein